MTAARTMPLRNRTLRHLYMVEPQRHPLGKILVALKYATLDQVKEALKHSKEGKGMRLGEAMQALGHCTDVQISRALSKQFGVPFVDLADPSKISRDVLALATPEQVREHGIVPVLRRGQTLTVASARALEYYMLDNLRFIFGCEVNWCLSPASQLAKVMATFYGVTDGIETLTGKDAASISFKELDVVSETDAEDDAGVVAQLVQTVISDAIKRGASDVHVEPMEDKLRIRYRIDGNCMEMESPPKKLQGPVLSRIKILANMDIAEKRRPQDGRIKIKVEGRDVDLRVSALPCSYGESMVLRILDKSSGLVPLEALGVHHTDFDRLQRLLHASNGVFLVTGPTGSGKTTTLYAALQLLNRPDVKIITAEEPVEYNIAGINQCQVRHGIGLDFARILRAMLRQAPDIILVGEIRDTETAEIAIRSALTGHTVFSTLHTNDAPGALTRLVNMGVKPFLVASALQGVLAQRLIRKLCTHCKAPYEATEAELKSVGFTRDQVAGKTLYLAVGCAKCGGIGYKGRMGVFELLEVNLAIREMIFQGSDTLHIRNAAIENGMTSLQVDGMRKVLAGLTTIDEVLTITHRDDVG